MSAFIRAAVWLRLWKSAICPEAYCSERCWTWVSVRPE